MKDFSSYHTTLVNSAKNLIRTEAATKNLNFYLSNLDLSNRRNFNTSAKALLWGPRYYCTQKEDNINSKNLA